MRRKKNDFVGNYHFTTYRIFILCTDLSGKIVRKGIRLGGEKKCYR